MNTKQSKNHLHQDSGKAVELDVIHAQMELKKTSTKIKLVDADWSQLPIATHKGDLEIGESKIPCYVLNDGRRLVSGGAVTRALGLVGNKGMQRFLTSKSLQPYLSPKLVDQINDPVKFLIAQKKRHIMIPLGYEAWVLPELCNAVLDAEHDSVLNRQQVPMAVIARVLSRAFATVGIVALVDEATGYQEVRDRNALQEILRRYISDELVEWAERFPPEFYREMFRLKGWQWSALSTKRPMLAGKYTADIVYQRLAPGVLEELRRKMPRDGKGRPKHKYHQFLTTDIGHPALERHLFAVIAFMKASTSWPKFYSLLQRALPKFSETLVMHFQDEEEEEAA